MEPKKKGQNQVTEPEKGFRRRKLTPGERQTRKKVGFFIAVNSAKKKLRRFRENCRKERNRKIPQEQDYAPAPKSSQKTKEKRAR